MLPMTRIDDIRKAEFLPWRKGTAVPAAMAESGKGVPPSGVLRGGFYNSSRARKKVSFRHSPRVGWG